MVKIAQVANSDEALWYLLRHQITSLSHAGYEVIAISARSKDSRLIDQLGVRHIPVSFTRSTRTPHMDIQALIQLVRIFRRENFIIVHTHNPKPAILGQIAAKIAGVPLVVNTWHGLYLHDQMPISVRRLYILLEKIAARFSDTILSQNREDMNIAVCEGICPPHKIKYIGNGINLSQFNPELFDQNEVLRKRLEIGIPPEARVVGFVGRLAARRKGFADFLRAAQQVVDKVPDVYLLVIGEPDWGKPDAVQPTIVRDYGLGERCVYLGQRPNSELPILYATMNVLVLPSQFEGIPRVVMEASAMKVPVVATDVKGNREALENGCNGILVPLGDIEQLSQAIVSIITDKQKAKHMGEEGRRIALERFDEKIVFTRIQGEYKRLLDEKGIFYPK
jgi:glycosyltransferase involved in cell wall biosynthesis